MKFVDEAKIQVIAGSGGSGSASFRREKYIQYGGPDGGDGGRGGSVILVAQSGLNTLVDFRHKKIFKAEKGQVGRGRQMYGRGGTDNIIKVPLGTLVYHVETGELMGDLVEDGQQLVVARGGKGGLGNLHFKSSTNRAPRRFTPGEPGEQHGLRLELKVLADVGLLGFPNAGKSTLIATVSAARPKIADYPFTTLYPNLGVVSIDHSRSFVIADIPGLIEGAADGAGLGIQFLKHLQRTRILLHLVELAPLDGSDSAEQVRSLAAELERFSAELASRPRWLVCSKADLMDPQEAEQKASELVEQLQWQGPHYLISSVTRQGTDQLMQNLMSALEEMNDEEAASEPDPVQ
jgi:GTP-binding protein